MYLLGLNHAAAVSLFTACWISTN